VNEGLGDAVLDDGGDDGDDDDESGSANLTRLGLFVVLVDVGGGETNSPCMRAFSWWPNLWGISRNGFPCWHYARWMLD